MNELAYGQKINIPISITRSVSFEKIRQGSLSSHNNKKIQYSKICSTNYQNIKLYEQLLSQKLHQNEYKIQKNDNIQKHIEILQENKIAIIKKQLQQKQMKQCTFKPKINKTHQQQRTLQQFIDQQNAFEKHKFDKVNQMRQIIKNKLDKQNTFQPTLIHNSNHQYSKKHSTAVHQRLYEQKIKRCQLQQPTPKSLQKTTNQKKSKPKITTYSRKNSDLSIVQSGLVSKKYTAINNGNDPQQFHVSVPEISESSKPTKRDIQCENKKQHSCTHSSRSSSRKGLKIAKYMDVQQVCERKLNQKKPLDKKQITRVKTKNKQIYINKILRQISSILSQLNITQVNLSYIQMTQILQKMNFIDETTNLNDRKYLFQIWQMLQGNIYQNCPLPNLIKIIFSFLGCHDMDIIEQYLTLTLEQDGSNKKLIINQKQSKNIKNNFEQLVLNRLKKGQYITNQPKSQQYPFKPLVSKNSVQMAQKYRQKVIQQSQKLMSNNLIKFQMSQSREVGHVDLLLLDDKCKQLKMKLKRQQHQKQKKRLEDQAMIGQKSKKSKQFFQSSQNTSLRFQHLYQLGKQNIRNKNEKIHDMLQIPKQCTFQPNIGRSKDNISTRITVKQNKQNSLYSTNPHEILPKGVQQIKDFDKTIFRMYEGRRIREQTRSNPLKQITDRSISDQQQYSHDQSLPMLYLNINMVGYDDVKVPVYHRDNMKIITYRVKTMLGLQYAEDNKLQQILRLQIIPTLKQINMNFQLQ